MAKTQRFYFIDTHTAGEKLAIVEKATNAVTVDGYTDNYRTISVARSIKIRGSFLDADLALNVMTGTFANIPNRFHECIVSKVIAAGYKDPRHMEIQTSQFFDNEYEVGIKRARKFSKGNYITVGRVVSQDF